MDKRHAFAGENLTTLRLRMLRNGYPPVPITAPNYRHEKVQSPGKQPFFKDWRNICASATEETVEGWSETIQNHSNTGILCNQTPGVDIDVRDPELARQLGTIARTLLGDTPLERVGMAPKTLLCYRTDAPFRKIETPELFFADGSKAQIEVLAEGQQFVAYGIHPDTGRAYEWLQGGPDTIPWAELPVVTEAQLRAFVDAAEAILRAAGGRTKQEIEGKATKPAAASESAEPGAIVIDFEKAASDNAFFRDVNHRALGAIETWFPRLFKTARQEPGTGAWRVTSKDLGRPNLEEDLSMHPTQGGHDFGAETSVSPIDVVMEWGNAADAKQAAHWLCDQMRVDPATLGWKEKATKGQEKKAGTAPKEWSVPDLAAAYQNRRAPPTLPVDVFGSFWADWLATAAEGASCPVDYVAGPFLAAAGMLIGNARWVSPWQGWKEPPVLWIANVGDPSSGKSPGADPVLDILSTIEVGLAADFETIHREWDTAREAARCARESWEKDVKTAVGMNHPPPIKPANAVDPAEPKRARVRVGDVTPEALGEALAAHPKGLLYFRDELAGWFGSFDKYGGNGSDRAFWIEAYGGRSYTIDRVKHPLPIVIPRLSVGVLGGVQPERLTDLLNSPDDGLQARFLWLWPDKVPPRRPTQNADTTAALEAFRRFVELPLVPGDGDNNAMRPFLCPLADAAADLFDQWRQEHSVAETAGTLASAYGKAPGHLLRLALILEHLWWCAPSTSAAPVMPPSRITIQAVRAAAALIEDYFKGRIQVP
jgi:hypothetical protein